MSENRRLVERHYENVNNNDFSHVTEVLSPDVVTVQPAGTMHGIDQFLGFAKGFRKAFPDARMAAEEWIEAGDRIAIQGVYTGTHTGPLASPQGEVPATGRTLTLPYCDVFEIAAGRITKHTVYFDQTLFAIQLGLMPAPTANPA